MDLEKRAGEFKAYLEKQYMLSMALGLMHWDSQTGAPKGGMEERAKRMGYFEGERFAMGVSEEMKGFLSDLEPVKDSLDENTRAQLRISKKNYDSYAKVPVEVAKEFSQHGIVAEAAWEEAREKKDFRLFAPFFKKTLALQKEIIQYRNNGVLDYNILLDDYEPGMTTEMLDGFFKELKDTIVPLVAKIKKSNKKIDMSFVHKAVPVDSQKRLAVWLAKTVGYDFNRGLIRESAHPFSLSLGRDDSRITTKYHVNDFFSSVFSVIHECGHAMYEQNKRDDLLGTILDDGISMGIHESQSRFYENVIARSPQFWQYAADKIKEFLPEDFQDVTAGMFFEAAAKAEPSLIRIEADELTYPLHIMVRYEMEKLMITQEVDVMELPGIWNKKYEEYLGITPENDGVGILQDIHWSEGLIGYFPSYAIGSAISAQLLSYMQDEFDVFGDVAKGDVSRIGAWLKKHIHQYGSLYEPTQLIAMIRGEGFDPSYYTKYIQEKFSRLYGLEN